MEIEALESILADEFKGIYWYLISFLFPCMFHRCADESIEFFNYCTMTEIHSSESGLNTSNRCFQITVTPQVKNAIHLLPSAISLLLFYLQLLSSRWSKFIVTASFGCLSICMWFVNSLCVANVSVSAEMYSILATSYFSNPLFLLLSQ